MKNRKIAFVLMAVSFVMIASGCVSSLIISLQADQKNVQNRMVTVNDEYENFSTNVSLFEEVRDGLYGSILGNMYYDTLFSDDTLIKNKLSNYENMVDEITKQVNTLDKLCEDVYYPDSSVNNKCSNYKSIYEQVVNYFVRDISLYNDNIKKYNEYQKSAGTTYTLTEYSTKKDYIDYNNDKAFDGKEE